MAIELADIMRRFGPLYLKRFSGSMLASHKRAISDIQQCRTEAMGGHIYQCGHCGKKVYVYHACRNRHCPACHRDQIHKWLEQRTAELLPCDYFHVTVTIPETLRHGFRIAITNHRIISMDETYMTFRYKDRKGGRWVTSRIEGCEFIRRYLQHVLPKGFHKVRYYGIWHKSNANHVSTLANSMTLAAIMSGRPITQTENEGQPITGKTLKCPHCGSDQLILLGKLPRPRARSPSPEISACP